MWLLGCYSLYVCVFVCLCVLVCCVGLGCVDVRLLVWFVACLLARWFARVLARLLARLLYWSCVRLLMSCVLVAIGCACLFVCL